MHRMLQFLLLFFLSIFSVHCETEDNDDLTKYLKQKAFPLESVKDLKPVLSKAENKKMVLLGEASHGTHEYYTWRDSISRKLITQYGYNFIAVEGDWASIYELNRYVKHLPGAASSAEEILKNLERWPTWMWGNREVAEFAEWLRAYNRDKTKEDRIGFYGMDVYDEWRSKSALLTSLSTYQPVLYEEVKEHLSCFNRFSGDSRFYARYIAAGGEDCSKATKAAFSAIEKDKELLGSLSDYDYFYILQNARVFMNAEKFFRYSATRQDASSWNSRVKHMNTTVEDLLKLYGEEAKGIVWAHNTHVGDARYTEMKRWNRKNIGQLSREKWDEENVMIIGFGTYEGTVKAGLNWEGNMINSDVPKARKGSIEDHLHQTGLSQLYLYFTDEDKDHKELSKPIGNRAIGVVYNPLHDHRQNYVNTIMPLRYDVFIFLNKTKSLNPF